MNSFRLVGLLFCSKNCLRYTGFGVITQVLEMPLLERVKEKLNQVSVDDLPVLFQHEVFGNIQQANKPKAGVPGDAPRRLLQEFSPELSAPFHQDLQEHHQDFLMACPMESRVCYPNSEDYTARDRR